ncbi:MAG TPA: hypothetical protein VGC23_02055 [Vicinamibacterales bacterium]
MRVMDSTGNLAQRPPVWMVYPLDLSPGGRWILAAWAAVGLLGVFVQVRFTGRTRGLVRAKVQKVKS